MFGHTEHGNASSREARHGRSSGREFRKKLVAVRHRAAELAESHAMALGLGAVALGFISAALLPMGEGERRMLSTATRKTRRLSHSLEEKTLELAPMTAAVRQLAQLLPTSVEHAPRAASKTVSARKAKAASKRPRKVASATTKKRGAASPASPS